MDTTVNYEANELRRELKHERARVATLEDALADERHRAEHERRGRQRLQLACNAFHKRCLKI